MEAHDIVQEAVIKTIPKKKKWKKAKWLSDEALQIAEKRREAKGFSWQNSVSLFPASFFTPRSNLPVTLGIFGHPTWTSSQDERLLLSCERHRDSWPLEERNLIWGQS